MGRRRQLQQLDQRRVEVLERNGFVAGGAFGNAGTGDDQIAVSRVVPGLHLGPGLFLSEMVAVVAPEDEVAVLGVRAGIPGIEQATDLFVGEGHAGEVGPDELLVVALLHEAFVVAGTELGLEMGERSKALWQIVEIVRLEFRKLDGLQRIAVEVFLGHDPGDVRPINAEGEKERVRDGFKRFDAMADRDIVRHFRDRIGGDAPVSRGVQLEADPGNLLGAAGLGKVGIELGVVPLVEVLGDPDGRPALRGEMLRQGNGVARIEAPGADAVVVDDIAGAGRMDSGEHGAARGKAGRRRADRVGEGDPALGEALDVGGDRLGVPLEDGVPVVPVVDVQEQHAGSIARPFVGSLSVGRRDARQDGQAQRPESANRAVGDHGKGGHGKGIRPTSGIVDRKSCPAAP